MKKKKNIINWDLAKAEKKFRGLNGEECKVLLLLILEVLRTGKSRYVEKVPKSLQGAFSSLWKKGILKDGNVVAIGDEEIERYVSWDLTEASKIEDLNGKEREVLLTLILQALECGMTMYPDDTPEHLHSAIRSLSAKKILTYR